MSLEREQRERRAMAEAYGCAVKAVLVLCLWDTSTDEAVYDLARISARWADRYLQGR